ncbi:hypothetical protein ACWDA7_44170 [Streptomyces sp. NPDC001156]
MGKPTTGTIYALGDPRDGSTRYIGKTTQDPLDRLAGHLATPTNPAMRVWINALGAQGLVPEMRPLKTVSVDKLDHEEQRQIERHAKAGHRLLNAPYYHRNLTDLFAPVLRTAASADSDAGDPIPTTVFGQIAADWAAGRLSGWQAAVRVVFRAPLVPAGHLLRMTKVRAVRVLLTAVPLTFYFWTIGYGRIVRDFVFPHLPMAALGRFWGDYLARPTQTLRWHLLAVALLYGLGSYFPVADAARAVRQKPAPRTGAAAAPSPLIADLVSASVAAQAAAALDSVVLPPQLPRGS